MTAIIRNLPYLTRKDDGQVVPNSATALWNLDLGKLALQEGWGLFDVNGTLDLQRLDEPEDGGKPVFDSDADAIRYVVNRALEGSAFHLLAIYLDRRDMEYQAWLPGEFITLAGLKENANG